MAFKITDNFVSNSSTLLVDNLSQTSGIIIQTSSLQYFGLRLCLSDKHLLTIGGNFAVGQTPRYILWNDSIDPGSYSGSYYSIFAPSSEENPYWAETNRNNSVIYKDKVIIGSIGYSGFAGRVLIYDTYGTLTNTITAWGGPVGYESFGLAIAAGSDRILIASNGTNYEGAVYGYDLNGGFLFKLTQPNTNFFGNKIAIGNGRIVISDNNNYIYIYNLDGTIINTIANQSSTAISINSGVIVIRDSWPAGFTIYDLNGKKLRTFINSTSSSSWGSDITVSRGNIIVNDPTGDSFYGAIHIYDLNNNLLQTLGRETIGLNDSTHQFSSSMSVSNGKIVASTSSSWNDPYRKIILHDLPNNTINSYYENLFEKLI